MANEKEKMEYDIDICDKNWYKLDTLTDHPAVPRVGDTVETDRHFYTVRRVVHRDEDPYQDEERLCLLVERDFRLSPYTAEEVRSRLLASQNRLAEWYVDSPDCSRQWKVDETNTDGRVTRKSFVNKRTGGRDYNAPIADGADTVDRLTEQFLRGHLRFASDVWGEE